VELAAYSKVGYWSEPVCSPIWRGSGRRYGMYLAGQLMRRSSRASRRFERGLPWNMYQVAPPAPTGVFFRVCDRGCSNGYTVDFAGEHQPSGAGGIGRNQQLADRLGVDVGIAVHIMDREADHQPGGLDGGHVAAVEERINSGCVEIHQCAAQRPGAVVRVRYSGAMRTVKPRDFQRSNSMPESSNCMRRAARFRLERFPTTSPQVKTTVRQGIVDRAQDIPPACEKSRASCATRRAIGVLRSDQIDRGPIEHVGSNPAESTPDRGQPDGRRLNRGKRTNPRVRRRRSFPACYRSGPFFERRASSSARIPREARVGFIISRPISADFLSASVTRTPRNRRVVDGLAKVSQSSCGTRRPQRVTTSTTSPGCTRQRGGPGCPFTLTN